MSLSKNIKLHPDFDKSQKEGEIIFVNDIKEFIKKLKDDIHNLEVLGMLDKTSLDNVINILAGGELVNVNNEVKKDE